MRLAGFWIRFVAILLDGVLLVLGFWAYLVLTDSSGQYSHFSTILPYLRQSNILSLISLIYTFLFWVLLDGTPGKLVLGLKIIDLKTEDRPSIAQYILRLLGYIPSALVLNLGYFWIGFDGNKQGWHDKIAGTTVVSSW